ncbi:MAG: hypothetical protein HN919_08190 [Verrucomicrobia bacterium]|nr:hypothetical protein [Verrucomicrobiota bacterium]MBT7066266.1 hypothetical protein [Verrucomicrobiota bacterium]MBT7700245.1 hypothetical protein [Verrucomicrobiota bacterium]
MRSIAEQILNEIRRHEEGWCFSQKDFMDIAGRNALEQAFFRLAKAREIRRIGRGLYDVPRYSGLLKTILSPVSNQIAKAIARKHGWRIQPTGAGAANLLNLSTQVPMKIVYLSDGPTKTMEFGGRTLYFRQTSPKDMATNELSGLVINALKYLGKEGLTPEIVTKLRSRFDDKQKKQLLKDAAFADLNLLHTVAEFKAKFYPASWANYHLATPGTFKLLPAEWNLRPLASDYKQMESMFYGEVPTFDHLMESLRGLEHSVNTLV